MIYLFFGTKKEEIRNKARILYASLRSKKPDASFGELGAEEVTNEKLNELIGGAGLFENKCVILCKDIFSDKESREISEKFIKELSESPNIFILYETGLTKAILTKLEKRAEKSQEIEEKLIKKENKPESLFVIADAFGRRDMHFFWLKISEAISNGTPAEELHGIVFWQLKSIILATNTKTAGEAGLNPFVFTKSKNFSKNFNENELHKLTKDLIEMYHDAHRGKKDFNIALEKFALSI